MISFSFLFLVVVLWFVDCHEFYELSQWQKGQRVVNSFSFLFFVVVLWFVDCHRPSVFAMTNGANGSIHKLVIARAWKARGNLSMGYNYLFMEFFLFSVFVFTISGLWIASSFHSSQWQRKNCHCKNRRFVAIHKFIILIVIG